MKKCLRLLLLSLFLFAQTPFSKTWERIWNSHEKDEGSIHSLGNGKMCVYERGPEVMTVYSSPYSTPSFYRLQLSADAPIQARSVREQGAAIWRHRLFLDGKQVGELTDFVDAEIPCFVRYIQAEQKVTFRLRLERYVRVIDNSGRWQPQGISAGLLLVVSPGTLIYQTYVYPRILYNQVLCQGAVSLQKTTDPHVYEGVCEKGSSQIWLIGGPEYPEVISNSERALLLTHEGMISRTKTYWQEFTARRTDFSAKLPDNLPRREKLLQTIDDVAVLIKTQQSKEGAVLAGYPYPLGYVRDQYGVSRGLLSLGCFAEARKILEFYWQVWKKFGRIHNAQAIGLDGVFHIHENDEVESPGYLIFQAFDLLAATGDSAFIREIFPMLEWAFYAQKKHLVQGMLPFNGDETYVAGGLLPRSALNDGSAESTMLFLESGERLLKWIEANRVWAPEKIAENNRALTETREKFAANFFRNGVFSTNNPKRAGSIEPPKFRHGVCERAGANCLMKAFQGVIWTERSSSGRYLCAACAVDSSLPAISARTYELASVALMPFYLQSRIVDWRELQPTVKEILAHYQVADSKRPQSDSGKTRIVGYEFGLLQNALTELGLSEAAMGYERTLSMVDQVGSWSEYYLNGVPNGTRCRPWESAINLEELIAWAMRQK